MDGKSRKFEPGKGVVNTPLCVTEPRVPLQSNLDDPEEWELSVLTDKGHAGTKYIAQNLLLVAQPSSVGSCLFSVAEYGYTVGTQPVTCGICGRPIGLLGMFCLVNCRNLFGVVEKEVSLAATRCTWEPKEQGLFFSGYGKASEDAVISSSPVSAVGGTSKPAVISSFSAEVTTPSLCPLRNLISTPESYGASHGIVASLGEIFPASRSPSQILHLSEVKE